VFFLLLPLFVLAHFSHHLVAAQITPLLPFIRDSLALDYTRAGVLVSAFNLAYGASQLPAGWLSDRFGSSTLIAIGISGVALCGLLIGISSHFLMMAAVLVLMGILGGGYHPSASPLISSIVQEKYRGRALGIHQIGGTASFFLAPLIAVGIARVIGWRGSFLTLSIPTLLYGVTLFLLLNRWGYGRIAYGNISTNSKSIDNNNKAGGHSRSLIPVIVLNSFIQIFIYSILSLITFYVVDHFGGSKEVAAALLSLSHSAGLWAGPLGGFLSDRIGKLPVLLFAGVITGPLLLLLNHVSLGFSISLVLLLIGMAMYISMPVTESYVISHAPMQSRSTLLGIYYFASRGGPGLMTPAVGYLIDKYRFSVAFASTGIAAVVLAVVCSVIIVRNELQPDR